MSNRFFNIQKKIARIRSQDYLNPKFTRVYSKENLPIDVIISPEIEIAKWSRSFNNCYRSIKWRYTKNKW